ncbi:MAG: MATE family efflux transporter [Terrisporobacter sp.]|uniref:MATE family efflux transporter n=1 Tax=Terrisporobacter sp. TaxID=1965305 RepID=UPI002FCA3A0F
MLDMTEGNPSKLILKFALPMILGNIFQQVYNLVDTIVVGKFIGADALAAVGSSFAIIVFITSIIIGLSMGAGILFAQFYGAKEIDKLKECTITSIIFIGIITIIVMFSSIINRDFILKLFNMPKELLPYCGSYLTIILYGLIFTFIYNLATALLRAVGDSKRPLYFLIIASIINVVLDLVFVIKFGLGVKGVALATIIAQGVSAALSFIYVYKNLSFIRLNIRDVKIKKDTFKLVAKYSVLTSLQQSIMNLGILIVQGLVNTFGVTVMAAFAAGAKIDSIAYMPVQDFGNAFSTYVAQNKGAKMDDRIRSGVKSAIKTIIIFSTVISSMILLFSKNIMLLFVNEKETQVITLGVEYISVVGVFYILIGFLFMFYGLYRGVGKLKISIILTIVSLGTRVLLAYVLSATPLGASGIWWSIPIGWVLADLLGFYEYKKLLK